MIACSDRFRNPHGFPSNQHARVKRLEHDEYMPIRLLRNIAYILRNCTCMYSSLGIYEYNHLLLPQETNTTDILHFVVCLTS